jgi:hypothetical protein
MTYLNYWESAAHSREKSLMRTFFRSSRIWPKKSKIEEGVRFAASAACVRPAVVKGDKASTRFVEEPPSQYPGRVFWIHRGIDPRF